MITEEHSEEGFVYSEKEVSNDDLLKKRNQFLQRLESKENDALKRKNKVRWLQYAAAAVVFLTLSIYLIGEQTKTVYAGFGEKMEKMLPDGTIIILNSDTKIDFKKGFEKKDVREVWIKGEAFFKVAKMKGKIPFVVHTDQFELNSNNKESSILLTEGSVIIKTKAGKEHKLKPGDYFIEETEEGDKKQLGENKPADAKPEAVLGWLDKHLVFENTPISQVAKEIELRYKIIVKIESQKIGNKTITGILPNDNLDVLLASIEATTEFIIKKENNIVTIQESK
jgi:ferric-dicitrate binding protein FerR (iron transport regulator)